MGKSPDHLYFIQCGDGGPIKIGVSFDPFVRLRTLQTAAPYPLQLLHSSGPLLDAPGYEARLHKRYAAIRLHGEWFLPADSLLVHITQIKALDSYVEVEA
jgi:hypothetical protein